jgi:hypothetical protein
VRDRTTILLEQAYKKVKEGAIVPYEPTINQVVDIFNSALQLRQQGYSLEQIKPVVLKMLAPLNMTIKDYENVATQGRFNTPVNKQGVVSISGKEFENYLNSPYSKVREQMLRRLLGHEYIHQLQHIRRMNGFNSDQRYFNYVVQADKRNDKSLQSYYNNKDEVMSFAYEAAKWLYDEMNINRYKVEGYTKDQIYKAVQQCMQTDSFINQERKLHVQNLTPSNVKRYYKYIYDYIGQLYDSNALEETQQPGTNTPPPAGI